MSVFDIIRRALLAGLGVQEAVRTFIDDLVKKGELSDAEAAKLLREWMSKAEQTALELERKINEGVHKTLSLMSLPSRDDIARLEKQIENLSRLLRDAELKKK